MVAGLCYVVMHEEVFSVSRSICVYSKESKSLIYCGKMCM